MNREELLAHESECRIYIRQLVKAVVGACWKETYCYDDIYFLLFRRTVPRPDIRECWLAVSGGAIDVKSARSLADPEALYALLESLISLVKHMPRPENEIPPAWPVRPEDPEQTLEWLSNVNDYLGLGSFADVLASGVPVEDILAGE